MKSFPTNTASTRLLIIEDDVTTAAFLEELLLSADYHEVSIAQTGASAIELFKQFEPEIVISDLNLPDIDGIEVLRQLRQIAGGRFFPALILSARSDLSARVDGLRWAEDYLVKPVNPVELWARIQSMTRLLHMERNLSNLNASLEERVMERTRDLQRLNHELNNEILRREAYQKEVQSLRLALEEIQESERAHLAGEIHDALGTNLLTLKLMIQTKTKDIADKNLLESCKQMLGIIDQTTEAARGIAHSLYPLSLKGLGLSEAIQELMNRFQAAFPSIHLKLILNGGLSAKTPEWNRAAFRLVQEALNNSIKHGNASRVTVEIDGLSETESISIRDNGSGIPSNAKKGIGFMLMRERAESMGWELQILSSDEGGTKIIASGKN